MMMDDKQLRIKMLRWMKDVEQTISDALHRQLPRAFCLGAVEVTEDELANRYIYPLTESSLLGFLANVTIHCVLDGEEIKLTTGVDYMYFDSHKKRIVNQLVTNAYAILDNIPDGADEDE